MVQQWKAICHTSSVRYTKRDALISAGVLIGLTFVITTAGVAAGKQGYKELGDVLKGLSFPVASTLSLPFAILKGQPKSVQTVVIGVTMAILLAAGWISTRI